MTGHPEFNRNAFMDAESFLLRTFPEFKILNPARMDEENGIVLNGASGNEVVSAEEKDRIVRRCVEAVLSSTHLYMLKGWEFSTGARGEHSLAIWARRTIIYQAVNYE